MNNSFFNFTEPIDDYKDFDFYEENNFFEEEKINNSIHENINKSNNNNQELNERTTKFNSNDNKDNFFGDLKKEENEEDIFNTKKIENKQNKEKEKKKCGRKKKNDGNNKIEHNKFSDDNLRRKIKHLVLKYIFILINNIISVIFEGNIGKGIFKKELRTINYSQKANVSIAFERNFLTKKLKDIFSENITGRICNYPKDYNRKLIYKLTNDNDESKRNYFINLFNLDFFQCLKHFRGEIKVDILEGLTCFNDIKDEIKNKYDKDGEEYYETLEYYLNNYEEIINKKRPRKSRKN